ncbi:MAG: hypothetical protein K0U37_07675 [Gammaproteobacteria bacterium]|nr:hypothetical protein [Gammaproteobacteria bacterium]
MKMWLYRTDLEEDSFDIPDMDDSDKEGDEIDGHLKVYTDCIKDSEEVFPAAAIQPLEALLQHYPNHEALLIRLTYLRSMGGLIIQNEALDTLKIILAANPQYEEALKLSIDICFSQEKFAEALPLLTTLINCEPEVAYHFTLRRRAEAYHALNQPDKALADLTQALSDEALEEAATRRFQRDTANSWQYNRYWHKQPILPDAHNTYGVISDKYTEYNENDESAACLALFNAIKATLQAARAAHAFHQPASSSSPDIPHVVALNEESDDASHDTKRQKVTRSGCVY